MLSDILLTLGHKVSLLCFYEFDPMVLEKFKNHGVTVKILHLDRKFSLFKITCLIKREICRIKPDIVHIQYMAPGAIPIIAARLAGINRIVATVHQPYTESHGKLSKIILRTAALLTTKFTVVSLNAENSWFSSATLFDENKPLELQPRHFTIHNAIDIDLIQEIISGTERQALKEELGIFDDKIIIGAVSRLRQEKGIDTLIQAFSLLIPNKENTHLLLVGAGPDEDLLKNQSMKLGISDYVKFYGQASWERSMRFLSVIDIVVVPSRFEGFGLTAAEAMAVGKPVIASDTTGLREIIVHGESGILFPVDDIFALKEAIEQLIENPSLRRQYSNNGLERVKKNFGIDLYKNKIKALYNLS